MQVTIITDADQLHYECETIWWVVVVLWSCVRASARACAMRMGGGWEWPSSIDGWEVIQLVNRAIFW